MHSNDPDERDVEQLDREFLSVVTDCVFLFGLGDGKGDMMLPPGTNIRMSPEDSN